MDDEGEGVKGELSGPGSSGRDCYGDFNLDGTQRLQVSSLVQGWE